LTPGRRTEGAKIAQASGRRRAYTGRVLSTDDRRRARFYDESQLHRHFRRIVGVAPGAYARSFVKNLPTSARANPRRRCIISP
jgi:AraC-like DNA-binding protein